MTHQGTQEVNEDKESHGETAESKQLRKEDQFAKVMDGRVDPATTLREQHPPRLGSDRVGYCIWSELRTEGREVLEKEGSEVTILSERVQILLVKCVDVGLRVFLDDAIGDDDGTTLVGRTDSIHGETPGKTGD